MKISRKYVPALTVVFIGVGVGLAVLLALFVGVGSARAQDDVEVVDGSYCVSLPDGLSYCCTWHAMGTWGWVTYTEWCTGDAVEAYVGCPMIVGRVECTTQGCETNSFYWCMEATGGDTWLADVCEPNDGFSDTGQMTWDSDHGGPLQVAASPDGPWYEVQVNGPPWVVTEEMMESFAGMVGLEDWHEMWLRSGDGNPQHVGNAIMEREGHMDTLCNP